LDRQELASVTLAGKEKTMGNPIVHFEIRAEDPDAARAFYGELFGWEYPEGGIPGYTYVESGVPGAIPGGIGPTQGGASNIPRHPPGRLQFVCATPSER
jgi:predicted enzyme related to lactoylglutathione lyase